MDKLDEAMREFRRAVALDPGDVRSFINLGNILLERKGFDEAAKCYRQAVAVDSQSADAYYGLGRVLEQKGDVRPAALNEFRRALPLAEQASNAALVEKIKAKIRRCEAWPWDEGKK